MNINIQIFSKISAHQNQQPIHHQGHLLQEGGDGSALMNVVHRRTDCAYAESDSLPILGAASELGVDFIFVNG